MSWWKRWQIGDDGDNTLTGSSRRDWLFGRGGNDTIHGGGGNDRIWGGSGNDTLFGDDGNDRISGGSGNDTIEGGDGCDAVWGGCGDDTINGGAGRDYLSGGSGLDVIHGGAGNDKIKGGSGNDMLFGDDGNDRIYGNSGNDHIEGGNGCDRVDGGCGDDTINGGAGKDRLYGGWGNDTIDGGDHADRIYGGWGNDIINGGDGNDRLYGGRGDDDMRGGAGDDKLKGERGNDTMDGGDGDDRLYGGSGDDDMHGGADNDKLKGGRGDDTLHGGDGNDRLYGGSGDDDVDGGRGSDRVYAGRGDDTGFFDSEENAGAHDYYNGGSGKDHMILRLGATDFASAAVQAELDAYQDFLDGGCTNGRSFHLDSLGLTLKNWESFEVETSNAPPVANADFVFASAGTIAETSEANDSTSSAQVIERTSFRVAPTADVEDPLLPRVSIQGTITPNSDADVYAIELVEGDSLTLDIDYGFESGSDNLDTLLFLMDQNGTVFRDEMGGIGGLGSGFGDDSSPMDGGAGSEPIPILPSRTWDSFISYEVPEGGAGTYFIGVSSFINLPSGFPNGDDGTFSGAGGATSGDYVLNVSIDSAAADLGGVMILADALLANDTDPDGDTLFITNVTETGNGDLLQTNLDSSGNVESVVFRPLEGVFSGSFDYTVSDGIAGHEVTTTANVSVSGGDTRPGEPPELGGPSQQVTGDVTDDVLIGSVGNDVFTGDDGSDVFTFPAPSALGLDQIGNDTITDFVVGTDRLLLEAGVSVSGLAEVGGNTEVTFDSGGMVTLVGVTGVGDVDDLFG